MATVWWVTSVTLLMEMLNWENRPIWISLTISKEVEVMLVADVAATHATNLKAYSIIGRNTLIAKTTRAIWTKWTRSMVSNSLRTCPIAVHTEVAEHLTSGAIEATAVALAVEMDVAVRSRWACSTLTRKSDLSCHINSVVTTKQRCASFLCRGLARTTKSARLRTANMNWKRSSSQDHTHRTVRQTTSTAGCTTDISLHNISAFKIQCQCLCQTTTQITINSLIRRSQSAIWASSKCIWIHKCRCSSRCGTRSNRCTRKSSTRRIVAKSWSKEKTRTAALKSSEACRFSSSKILNMTTKSSKKWRKPKCLQSKASLWKSLNC